MRLLLDTHIWLWSLLEPTRLSGPVLKALADREAELWLSPISVWELGILVDKGRIRLQVDLARWIDDAMQRVPLREAPLTQAIVRCLGAIETPHRDPADRFLAATAAALGLTLVTADARLLAGRGYEVLSNAH